MDINKQLTFNKPMIEANKLVQIHEKFNHNLTIVTETSRVSGVINFVFIGENKETGSLVTYTISYSKIDHTVFLISFHETITDLTPVDPDDKDSKDVEVHLTTGDVFIVTEGSTIHTYYPFPIEKKMVTFLERLQELLRES